MIKEYTLKNGIKLIYKNHSSNLTSLCVSLKGGALMDGEKYGVAHATEHMVYKGTKNRTEEQINIELSEIFGFQNAMTNYPYVIYYGTLLSEDLSKGIDLFSDIIINPVFDKNGFNDEKKIIIEELKEWDEDIEQYLEDKLFINSFNNRRIKYPIIGTFESLENLKVDDIKEFYSKVYFPSNTSISIITNIEFDKVIHILEKYFGSWNKKEEELNKIVYEKNDEKYFEEAKQNIKTSKIQINYPIDNLNNKEIKALKIFNEYFGDGVNSKLFDTLRTKYNLVYDVLTRVCYEEGIKFYKITLSTSKENYKKAIEIIDKCVNDSLKLNERLTDKDLDKFKKSFKLKRLFREEQSIVLAKELATFNTMFNDYNIYIDETENLDDIDLNFIVKTITKVFDKKFIQVLK